MTKTEKESKETKKGTKKETKITKKKSTKKVTPKKEIIEPEKVIPKEEVKVEKEIVDTPVIEKANIISSIKISDIITYAILVVLMGTIVFLFICNNSNKKEINKTNDTITELSKLVDNLKERMDEVNPPTKTIDEVDFKTISPSQIVEESEDETIVVMIGRSDCGWCQRFIPVLEDASKEYKFTPRYVDLYEILDGSTWEVSNEAEHKALMSLKATDNYKTFVSQNFGATPLTIIVKNGTIINGISGYVKLPDLRNKLEESGFTK